jgi:ABC-type lipoprotein export system ATPase subunit
MLDTPSEGEYFFDGQPVHAFTERQLTELHKHHIGFVFQSYHLIDDLTVAENLDTPLLYKKIKGVERKGLVAEALDRFHIVAKKDLFPNQLSGGQQQRVAIARAIITKPKLILADEPTGNLNSKKEIMEMFAELNAGGTTIIQVTHSEQNAAYGRRTIRLLDGWVQP